MKKVVIIGGGISGLTAAVYGAKAGLDVTLFEQHTIPGGEWYRVGSGRVSYRQLYSLDDGHDARLPAV